MPRRVAFVLLTVAFSVAAVPAVAQAAVQTYTVDTAAAGSGCDAARLCKTVTAAVAAVADGDTIVVKPGTYQEAGKITLTKKDVTIQGTPGRTTIFPAASAAAGDPTFTLAQGNVLDGITVATAANAGPAIRVMGPGTVVKNGAILRVAASTADAPAYAVDAAVTAGTSTVQQSTIVNAPAGASAQTQPAVSGNATSTLALTDVLVISGAGNGPAVALVGNDKNADATAIANTITRSTLIAQRAASDALTVTGAADDARRKAVTLDSTALLPGASGTGVSVATLAGSLPGQDSSGDVKVIARHVTVAGGEKPFVVAATSSGTPAGSIDVTFDRSIVHARSQGTVTSFTPILPPLPLPIPIPGAGGTANTARVVISASDTTQEAIGAASDKATVTVAGKTNTPDARLFVNLARANVRLRANAPAIDKGGPAVAGESTTDFEGQPRLTGAATDLGADEFLNLRPTASAVANPRVARQGAAITFDASSSSDPEAGSGGGIAKYQWAFGDGSTQETTTPTVTHSFAQRGFFDATLTVVDTGGLASASFAIPRVAIVDGTPPVVRLTSPTANRALKVFVTKKVKKGTRTVSVTRIDKKRLVKVLFKGTVTDASPLRSVELAIRRVSVAKGTASSSCVYLVAMTTFKAVSCKKPAFFVVQQKSGAFGYRFKSTLRPKAGLYEVSARATDAGGVVSSPVRVRFRLT